MYRLFFALLITVFSWQAQAQSQTELSCNELGDASMVLEAWSDELYFQEQVKSGSELDNELLQLVDAISEVAFAEKNPRISKLANQLEQGWINQDWQTFQDALLALSDLLEMTLTRDCGITQLSCPDLTIISETLALYADKVYLEKRIREGSRLDQELAELVAALADIAEIEQNTRLSAVARDLELSWFEKSWDAFSAQVTLASYWVDQIYTLECR